MADLYDVLAQTQYKPQDSWAAIAGSTVANIAPALIDPYGSTGSNVATSIGAGLLAGLLGGYARYDAEQQNQDLNAQAMELFSAPSLIEQKAIVAQNPRLSPLMIALQRDQIERKQKMDDAVNLEIRKTQALQPYRQSEALDNALRDYGMEQGVVITPNGAVPIESLNLKTPTQVAEEKVRAEKMAGAQTEIDKYKLGGQGFNPWKSDEENKLRGDFEKLEEVQNFKHVKKSYDIILKAIEDDSAVSDLELVRYAILLIEPGMAVREGEQAAVAKTNSISEEWKGEMRKALVGKAALGPEIREGLKRLALRSYSGHKDLYESAYNKYTNIATQRELNVGNVVGDIIASPQAEEQLIKDSAGNQYKIDHVTKQIKRVY